MEALTSILLVLERVDTGTKVLEKAIALARCFSARVYLLVEDSNHAGQFASLCGERGYDEVAIVSAGRGSLTDAILDLACERSPDFLVTARAGAHAGSTGVFQRNHQQLTTACPMPLMLMSERAWHRPVRIAAAVDISRDEAALARAIVQVSGILSLGCEGDLAVLYSEREQFDASLRIERVVRLARLVREFHIDGQRIRHINGAPEETLPVIAASDEYDILVVGALTHLEGVAAGRATLTRKVVAAFDGDVVLVNEDVSGSARQSSSSLRHRAAL